MLSYLPRCLLVSQDAGLSCRIVSLYTAMSLDIAATDEGIAAVSLGASAMCAEESQWILVPLQYGLKQPQNILFCRETEIHRAD
jgi:hypothetical protein